MKLLTVYSLALVTLVLSLTACGKQDNQTQTVNYCGGNVAVTAAAGDYPKQIISIDSSVVKFCAKNTDGTVSPWRGGYRSVASPTCGFWAADNQLTADISLSLNAETVDCQ